MVINGDQPVTSNIAVTLTNDVLDADEMRFSNDQATWSEWVAFAPTSDWTLTTGDGPKTVYAEFRDGSDNLLELSDDITLDTTGPAAPVMAAEPAFTTGLNNTVGWSDSNPGYLAEAATDPDFTNVVFTSGWITSTFYDFTGLTDGQIYYYRAKARDAVENESDWSNTVFSTQDATAPVSLAGPLDPFQSASSFDVPWSGSDETSGLASVELFVNKGSGWESAGSTTDVDPPVAFSYTATTEGTYQFYTTADDRAGNSEGIIGSAEATTIVDLTAPEGTLAVNGGDETTNDVAVTLNSANTDANGVVSMRFSNTGDFTGVAWETYAETFDWTLETGDGLKTVSAEYQDPAGNVFAVSDDITLDTTPPGQPVLVAEPEFTIGTSNAIAWSDAGAVDYYAEVATDAGFTTLVNNSGWVTELTFNFTGLIDGGTYFYRVKGRDELANESDWSDAVFSTQDATPPATAADPLPTYQGGADITVTWTGNDATSGLESVELFVNANSVWISAGVTTQVDPPEPFVYTAPEAGTYRFYTLGTDAVGNTEVDLGTVDAYTTVDLSAPDAASNLDANPNWDSISLTWTNPEDTDVDVVEVWAALWTVVPGISAYPEYDDIAPAPVRPGSRASAESSEAWVLVASLDAGTTTFVHSDEMESPGVYYYEVFLGDYAGNFSSPAEEGTRATNYILGDFNNDGDINVFDITIFGASYGLLAGEYGFSPLCDIGPTDDTTSTGILPTDNEIEFDDLAIIALGTTVRTRPRPRWMARRFRLSPGTKRMKVPGSWVCSSRVQT